MSKVKIIKYGADWCGPCRTITDLCNKHNVNCETIDIEDSVNEYYIVEKNIKNIPYIELVEISEDDTQTILCSYKEGLDEEDIIKLKDTYGHRICKENIG